MEIRKQFTAFLENKPGRLANICAALAKEKINIDALTIMDSKEHSVLRLVTDDGEATRRVLTRLGTPFQETEVLQVEMINRPGSLARVCEKLAAAHINIDYAYCSTGVRNGKTIGIFKVSNLQKAMKVLSNNGNTPTRQGQKPGRLPIYARR
jgi:hypothetical protein